MDQKTSSNKIIKELKTFSDYSTDQLETFRMYLNMVYSIGFNEGNSRRGSPRPIVQLNRFGNKIKEFHSTAEAGRCLGIRKSNITQAIKGTRATAGGFKFAYKT